MERDAIHHAHAALCPSRVAVHNELNKLFANNPSRFLDHLAPYTSLRPNFIGAIKTQIVKLAELDCLNKLDERFKKLFHDVFPSDIPHIMNLPSDVVHHIEVLPGSKFATSRPYSCPWKYYNSWKTLIDQHLAAGWIRPSSSSYSSSSFIIPKADPSVLPCRVVNYQHLNKVTIPDAFPLPRIDNILTDCAKSKIWGKIDMTNLFFQILVHPNHVKYTATLTPFGALGMGGHANGLLKCAHHSPTMCYDGLEGTYWEDMPCLSR